MAKLVVIAVCCLTICVQMSYSRDLAELDTPERLKGYDKFQQEDDSTNKDDLNKPIEVTVSALKANGVDEQHVILNKILDQLFNIKNQLADDIRNSIEFYKLLGDNSEFKNEIEKTIATLETLQKDSNFQETQAKYLALNKDFTPEFQKFLAENSLPIANRKLQKTAKFFEKLLEQDDIEFEDEIEDLKAKADAALAVLSIEEKQAALYQITNPPNLELYEFLKKKLIELN